MGEAALAGFWSYVRADDGAEGGRIVRLAELVKNEYAMLTGREIDVFADRDIRWGDEWKRRIDEALQGTAFFIGVITPSVLPQRCVCSSGRGRRGSGRRS